MRINRRFLYTGVFLVALGAVLVAADLGALDVAVVRDALRLWPVAVVLIGVALVVRRSFIALPAGLLAASIPGLALGGALAVGPRVLTECGAPGTAPVPAVTSGTFDAAPTISIRTGCGTVAVSTAPGSGWQLTASNTRGERPTVESTPV